MSRKTLLQPLFIFALAVLFLSACDAPHTPIRSPTVPQSARFTRGTSASRAKTPDAIVRGLMNAMDIPADAPSEPLRA